MTVDFGRLGLGTAPIGNLYREVGDDSAREVLDAAWDGGIRYYDTAPHYGLGLAERRLGAFLRGRLEALDFQTELLPQARLGDHVVGRRPSKNGK